MGSRGGGHSKPPHVSRHNVTDARPQETLGKGVLFTAVTSASRDSAAAHMVQLKESTKEVSVTHAHDDVRLTTLAHCSG